MEKPVVGDVVVSIFPFSNLKGQKRRPVLVVAKSEFNNLILCQITSKPYYSKTAIKLSASEFIKGKLPVISYIRPDKLFTAEVGIIIKTVGKITEKKKKEVLGTIIKLFK